MSNSTPNNDSALSATLVFLDRTDKHKKEKPYKLQYDAGGAIPRTNTVSKPYGPILIEDIRNVEKRFTFEENGFSTTTTNSKLSAEDFYDEETVRNQYYAELKCILLRDFGASRVEILEHLVRRRHAEFPVSTGVDYDHLQPTSVVHTDFTLKSALEASQDVLKIDHSVYRRIQCINIWKPLRGPLSDWPLAVCDETTTDLDADYIASDVVSRVGFTENYLVYFNPKQKWYYLSGQKPNELMLFRQADTKYPELKGVPHSGFQNPKSDPNEVPRESIETRAFLYYID